MTRMGKVAMDRLERDGRLGPGLHSLGDLSPDRRFIVHFPETRDDLERRLGLRRQRPARQEVLRAADRLDDGPRPGLAGRAHADPGLESPDGDVDLHRRRLPQRLRQDQPGHAPVALRGGGLEGLDGRRGHRLDQHRPRRPAVGDQSGSRATSASRRAPTQDQPERDGRRRQQHDLHQRRA